jgi:opacity protein-like surface antigen
MSTGMRKVIVMIAAVLTFVLVAAAQDVPQMEAFLGYNYVRFNPNSVFFPPFNANGGGGQFVYNFNRWIGGVGDISAVTASSLGRFNIDSTLVNFVAGPRVTYHNDSRFQPFAQVLFGAAYATASVPVAAAILAPGFILPPGTVITTRVHASNTGFAMFVGGGLDIKVSEHIAIRPIGADYYFANVPRFRIGDDTSSNNFRYSAGISFLFGAQ